MPGELDGWNRNSRSLRLAERRAATRTMVHALPLGVDDEKTMAWIEKEWPMPPDDLNTKEVEEYASFPDILGGVIGLDNVYEGTAEHPGNLHEVRWSEVAAMAKELLRLRAALPDGAVRVKTTAAKKDSTR